MSKNLLEDLMSVFYPDVSLPPLLQVIYHEAMRGNHLVFDREKLASSDLQVRIINSAEAVKLDDQTVDFVFGLLTLNDLNEIRTKLNSIPTDLYRILYRIYLHLLDNLKIYVKSQLN